MTSQRKTELYRAANLECARIIAVDPVKYPGVIQEWAQLVLQCNAEKTKPGARRAAGSL